MVNDFNTEVARALNSRNFLIGATTDTGYRLYVSGSGTSGSLNVDNTLYVNSNRNVLIGTTTDAGYKLDVNGTARVSGNFDVASSTILKYTSGGTTNDGTKLVTNNKLMVVGDDAQAIYAFRGSSVKYIWDFENEYDNVKKFLLETNYRSTPSIVNYFQDIISHNINQFKKNVKSNQIELFWTASAGDVTQYKVEYILTSDTDQTGNGTNLPLWTSSVTNKALSSNVATLTTSTEHGFTTGQTVLITGVDSTFNGTYTITSTPTTTTFTYANSATNVTSTAVTPNGNIISTSYFANNLKICECKLIYK
jgi:hypothetical protein